MRRFLLPILCSLLLLPVLTGQQLDTALIVGTVTDATGAVVPGATVRFNHGATGTVSQTTTNEVGNYRSAPLRIGQYTVTVEAQGFKTYTGTGVNLSIGDIRQLQVALELGQISEVVQVEASAPLLQTNEASAGTVIENRQIVDLPLNGRDYLQLAVISSGTVQSRGQGVSIGGQRGSEISFLMDGMDNNNQAIASQGRQKETVKPSVDAIAEFRVITNGFSAEYGRSSAGIVSLSIKSGTNELHGTGFYFQRHDKLDAKNFFDPPDVDKPPFKRYQYGFAVGGPIKRNKSFLFGDMEWTDVRESATIVSNVPTPAMKNGDFRELAEIIYDPATWNGTERQPFPNNIIPANRLDPVTSKMRNWWPDPQTSGLRNNFVFNPPRNQDFRKWDIRFDQNLTDSDNFFLRWSSQQQDIGAVPQLPPVQGLGSMSRGSAQDVTSNNAVAAYNRVWTPSLLSTVRFGWNYIDTDNIVHPDIEQNINAVVGLSGFNQVLRGGPEMTMSPWRQIGNNTFLPNLIQSQTRQLSVDNTWTTGRHAVRFGAQLYWLQSFIQNPQRANGTITFDGRFTERSPSKRSGSGDALADFLLGFPREMQGSNGVYMNLRAPFYQFYLQDDWRISQRLTLNLGLRYEFNAPWVETRDGISNFDLGSCYGCNDGFIEVAGSRGDSLRARALVDPDYLNFAPRFGLAYKLTEKTVLRAAYGVFYGNVSNTGGGEFMETMPPFHIKASLATGRVDPFLKMGIGLPPGTITPTNAEGVEMSSFERDPKWPMAQNWNFNIQWSLPGDVLWETGYFGNKMNHIISRLDLNAPQPGPGAINPRRPWTRTTIPEAFRGDEFFEGSDGSFISLGRMNRHENRFNTLYHGLHTKVEKRYSAGLTYIASYAWSHAIGDTRGIPGSGDAPGSNARFVLNPLDLSRERGNSAQDMRHRFIGSVVYELPFGQGKVLGGNWNALTQSLLGGWSIGTIFTLTSGTPQELEVLGNPANVGGGDRPDVVPGVDWRVANPDPALWYNPAAFVPNEPYTYGNAGKNILVGPGQNQWDFSAYKQFRIVEKYSVQFRFEAFNFLNHPNFGFPNGQVGNRNFGVISSADTPRNLQFGLKLLF